MNAWFFLFINEGNGISTILFLRPALWGKRRKKEREREREQTQTGKPYVLRIVVWVYLTHWKTLCSKDCSLGSFWPNKLVLTKLHLRENGCVCFINTVRVYAYNMLRTGGVHIYLCGSIYVCCVSACLCVCVWYVRSSVLLSVQEGGVNLVIRHRNGWCGRLPRLCRLDCGYVRQKHCHQLGRRPHSDGSQVRKVDDTFPLWCLRWTLEKGCTVLLQHFRSQLTQGWPLVKGWQPSSSFAELGQCVISLSLIHIWRCRRVSQCRSRWSPYH